MKCPVCGAELNGKNTCGRCGSKIERQPEIEVEYKDFKVSEYLEIRQKEHKTSSEAESGVEGKILNAKTHRLRPRRRRRVLSFPAAAILLLLAGLGVYLFWRFLIR